MSTSTRHAGDKPEGPTDRHDRHGEDNPAVEAGMITKPVKRTWKAAKATA